MDNNANNSDAFSETNLTSRLKPESLFQKRPAKYLEYSFIISIQNFMLQNTKAGKWTL